jgi:penicillin-binding protein 1C
VIRFVFRRAAVCVFLLGVAGAALTWRTLAELRPPALHFASHDGGGRGVQLLDRHREPLSVTFTNPWNVHDVVALHEIPPFLRSAFIAAEDKRFFEHDGADWLARAAALVTNVRNVRAVRGASTITEQVVRMLHPRPRTIWSRWLEGWEAASLERVFGKNEILEFYLNQVPYAANRRGVRQAASYYFARDLGTLSKQEMLALAVLVRAPTRFDLRHAPQASEGAIRRLADALAVAGALTPAERAALRGQTLTLQSPQLPVAAPHFIRYARANLAAAGAASAARRTTTLDAGLQAAVQGLLDRRVQHLRGRRLHAGAVLAVEHGSGEVLAWAVAGGGGAEGPTSHIDAVTTLRQPGSALKPFLYALALDGGWTASAVIDDAPLAESTSGGLHSYENYSRRFYGPVTLRDALGNSLNIPALKTLQSVGIERYLDVLRALGFAALTEHPDFYGDGIALGSGAVTLFELVQAYAVLANGGVFRPLSTVLDDPAPRGTHRVFSAEAASLVANILSDPDARALEFGRDGILSLPLQTAVKTGTSSDFRDAWAVGFNHRHTVGVWMGNLDQTPTDGVTGSTGPALLLRSVFAELGRDAGQMRPLYLSPRLTRHGVCVPAPPRTSAAEPCVQRDEWFLPGTTPAAMSVAARGGETLRFSRPTPGLQLAYDPRLPAGNQVFEFVVNGTAAGDRVVWAIDGQRVATESPAYRWPVTRGQHRVAASIWRHGAPIAELAEVAFTVR